MNILFYVLFTLTIYKLIENLRKEVSLKLLNKFMLKNILHIESHTQNKMNKLQTTSATILYKKRVVNKVSINNKILYTITSLVGGLIPLFIGDTFVVITLISLIIIKITLISLYIDNIRLQTYILKNT